MKVTQQHLYGVVAAVAIVILFLDAAAYLPASGVTGKKDDWQYGGDGEDEIESAVATGGTSYLEHILAGDPSITTINPGAVLAVPAVIILGGGHTTQFFQRSGQASLASAEAGGVGSGDLGYATGGAKDVNNFRDNIEEGYTPIPTDIPYEGLFYEYYFDTGQQERCEELFCPSYSTAITEDPLSDETEHYMTVGLNSNMKESEFERKKLNLVLVLDISGSMGSSFDKYYYDRFGNRQEVEEHTGKNKMQVAAESLAALTRHLKPGDRLGVVLFNHGATVAKPLNPVEETDMGAIRNHMLELRANGGTNMASGMKEGTAMLNKYTDADPEEYENRIIFLTDAMPNIGTRSESGLLQMMEDNADKGIYTTFVGMGVDFNTELVDAITAVQGANSFAVHSSKQFKERMDDQFKYMVSPLVFNLTTTLDSDAYDIKKVYGSTAADEATGQIMKVNTLFPSPTEDGETKGGVVLLQLEKTGQGEDMELSVSYETRSGKHQENVQQATFPDQTPDFYENSGIRKAVLLSRYADLMKNWAIHEHDKAGKNAPAEAVTVARKPGIEPAVEPPTLGRWERQSVPLRASGMYQDKIQEFRPYFEQEMNAIGDDTLQQEIDILDTLLDEQ